MLRVRALVIKLAVALSDCSTQQSQILQPNRLFPGPKIKLSLVNRKAELPSTIVANIHKPTQRTHEGTIERQRAPGVLR